MPLRILTMTEPPPVPSDGTKPSKPAWYRRLWFHIVLIIILPYVQVPTMWILKAFSLRTRIIMTVIGCWSALMQIFPDPFLRVTIYAIFRPVGVMYHLIDDATQTETNAEVETVSGQILSVTEDGILITKHSRAAGGWDNETVFFVKGRFNYVDDDWVTIKAYPSGTYRYETAAGAVATVRAYKAKQ